MTAYSIKLFFFSLFISSFCVACVAEEHPRCEAPPGDVVCCNGPDATAPTCSDGAWSCHAGYSSAPAGGCGERLTWRPEPRRSFDEPSLAVVDDGQQKKARSAALHF